MVVVASATRCHEEDVTGKLCSRDDVDTSARACACDYICASLKSAFTTNQFWVCPCWNEDDTFALVRRAYIHAGIPFRCWVKTTKRFFSSTSLDFSLSNVKFLIHILLYTFSLCANLFYALTDKFRNNIMHMILRVIIIIIRLLFWGNIWFR